VRLTPQDLAPSADGKASLDAGVGFEFKFGQPAPLVSP
jgi:hypothetical protein